MAAAARKPVESQPTHGDLATMIHRVSECVEKLGRKVDSLGEGIDEVKDNVADVREKVAFIEGRQTMIATRVGVHEDDPRPVRTAMPFNRWKLLFSVLGAITALPVIYFILAKVAVALHQALMGLAL